eukprot:11226655-Lingulodinium_polyedra.AAC.1
MARKGAFQRASPFEDVFVFWLRMDRDLKKAFDKSDRDIPRVYRKVCLDMPCMLVVSNTRSDTWWREYNLRGRVGQQYWM